MLQRNKRSRINHLILLLQDHPKGLKRSEIAKRLGIHRSTAGRYIMELSEETMLWENNFRVGISDRRTNLHIPFSLAENLSIQVAIQAIGNRLDTPNQHLETALRKLSMSIKQKFPVTSDKLFQLAEKIGKLTETIDIDKSNDFEQLAMAIEKREPFDIQMLSSQLKCRILPEEITVTQSGSLNKSLRIAGKCSKTGGNCSFLLHNIKVPKECFSDAELLECPFDSIELDDDFLLKLRIYTPDLMDNLSSITDKNFQFKELPDGSFMVTLVVDKTKDIIDKLQQMGSDIEVVFPEEIRKSMINSSNHSGSIDLKQPENKQDTIKDIENEDFFKDVQIREIHHRIKNQFGSLIGLINLYRNKIENHSTISILDEIKAKIMAFSNVHSMLSKGNLWTGFSTDKYLPELLHNLINNMEYSRKIDLETEIGKINLPEEHLLNIGLIVTELCINSLKYAFTDRAEGKILISMVKENRGGKETITLRFKDNGRGLGNNPDITLSKGTGHNLVNIFVARLNGSIEYLSDRGTEIVITFS